MNMKHEEEINQFPGLSDIVVLMLVDDGPYGVGVKNNKGAATVVKLIQC